MKEWLVNGNALYLLGAVAAVTIVMKLIASLLYQKLIRESGQMGTTANRWMKSMMAKFEAYYKLRISIHNVENFVDHYLYQYHFMGCSLSVWEHLGITGMVGLLFSSATILLLGAYYQFTSTWFVVHGIVALGCLLVQLMAEGFSGAHRSQKRLRIQLIDKRLFAK